MKMKENKINNADDLRLEILRLNLLAKEQEAYLGNQYQLLKQTVETPLHLINNAISWLPGGALIQELFSKKDKSDKDWVSRLFSVGSSAVLNRFLLKRSGFIKRLMLTFLSEQAAGMMNKDRVTTLISKVADYIRSGNNKKEKEKLAKQEEPSAMAPDFGIPPDSEAS